MSREDVFIANILKSRPPGNRDPQPEEIEACWPYLERQIQLIEPRVIATLGNFATKKITGSQTGITRCCGTPQVHALAGRTVFVYPLFHPAAALRTPSVLETGCGRTSPSIPALLAEPLPELEQADAPEDARRSRSARRATASSTCSLDRRDLRGPGGDRGAWGADRRRARARRRRPGQRRARQRQDDARPRRLPGARRQRAGRLADVHDRAALPRRARTRSRTSTCTGSTGSPARSRASSTTTWTPDVDRLRRVARAGARARARRRGPESPAGSPSATPAATGARSRSALRARSRPRRCPRSSSTSSPPSSTRPRWSWSRRPSPHRSGPRCPAGPARPPRGCPAGPPRPALRCPRPLARCPRRAWSTSSSPQPTTRDGDRERREGDEHALGVRRGHLLYLLVVEGSIPSLTPMSVPAHPRASTRRRLTPRSRSRSAASWSASGARDPGPAGGLATPRCSWPRSRRASPRRGGWERIERIAVGNRAGHLHRAADRDRDGSRAGPGSRAADRRGRVARGARSRDRGAGAGARPAGADRRPPCRGLRRALRRVAARSSGSR